MNADDSGIKESHNLEDIARIAMIPANYVAAALTDDWPEIVKVVKASAFLGA